MQISTENNIQPPKQVSFTGVRSSFNTNPNVTQEGGEEGLREHWKLVNDEVVGLLPELLQLLLCLTLYLPS